MNIIIKWGVRKFVLNIVNSALDKYNRNISVARSYVSRYTGKVSALLRFLNSLDSKLADGQIKEEEADALVEEAETLAKELVA